MVVRRPKVVVVVFTVKENKLLIGKRQACVAHSYISVFSGHLEFGESFEECATREVKEEMGLDIMKIEILKVTNNLFLYDETNLALHYVAILVHVVLVDPNKIPHNLESQNVMDGNFMIAKIYQTLLSHNLKVLLKKVLILSKIILKNIDH
uniref:Nudix hydrolase domain-containing protein n=1 Tax=Solanum lycopersicum TaxID=4081 RepID=A0A3Q7FHA3_SOLLC